MKPQRSGAHPESQAQFAPFGDASRRTLHEAGARRRRSSCSSIAPIAAIAAVSCLAPPHDSATSWTGGVMGTTYSVTVVGKVQASNPRQTELRDLVQQAFDRVDRLMSTYRQDSEVNLISLAPGGVSIPISAETLIVLHEAQRISEESEGLFDVTVAPIVELWGFGPQRQEDRVPGDEEIARVRAAVGFRGLQLSDAPPSATKERADLRVDLSAIAKGFAVDQAVGALLAAGESAFMVELGGEVAVRGHNAEGHAWRIAVESPDAPRGVIQGILELPSGYAMATSGDYRNYFEQGGLRYSHTMNPRTGRPVFHNTASVTVIHPSTTTADGYATALLVMGASAGIPWAEQREIAALFLTHAADGSIVAHETSAFRGFMTTTNGSRFSS